MSLSKAALNMAEALRPVLVKLIPQKMLSAVKAKVIEKGAKDLEKTEITPFEPQAHKKGINLIGSIKSDTGLGQSMRLVAEILENSMPQPQIRLRLLQSYKKAYFLHRFLSLQHIQNRLPKYCQDKILQMLCPD